MEVTTMTFKKTIPAITLIIVGHTLWAQHPPRNPMEENLFPPELIMHNQRALDLSEEQEDFIKNEIVNARAHVSELEWDLQSAMQSMVSLMQQEKIDEEAVLIQLENVLTLEHGIKKSHLSLVIRIKNQLNPEQREKLMLLKRENRRWHPKGEKKRKDGRGRLEDEG